MPCIEWQVGTRSLLDGQILHSYMSAIGLLVNNSHAREHENDRGVAGREVRVEEIQITHLPRKEIVRHEMARCQACTARAPSMVATASGNGRRPPCLAATRSAPC